MARSRSHRVDEGRYEVVGNRLNGKSVLLFYDTFTSGANAFSALDALRPTKARVAIVVIGRHFKPDWSPNTRAYYDVARNLPFDLGFCALCDRRPEAQLTAGGSPKRTSRERKHWQPKPPPWEPQEPPSWLDEYPEDEILF